MLAPAAASASGYVPGEVIVSIAMITEAVAEERLEQVTGTTVEQALPGGSRQQLAIEDGTVRETLAELRADPT